MIKLVIIGAHGRMGRMVQEAAAGQPDLAVVGRVDLGDDPAPAVAGGDVVIDFSVPAAAPRVAALCAEHRRPLVLGTTGLSDTEKEGLTRAAAHIPLVWSANYSSGVNLLFWIARHAATILGPDFDLEIVELHHRHKKDAPSGTALRLAEILAAARRLDPRTAFRHGRHGQVGARPGGEIGLHAVRGGDVVGDHTVIFAGEGERVELTHKASSRATFALGALRAARWVRGQPPGLYDMQDVLGLK